MSRFIIHYSQRHYLEDTFLSYHVIKCTVKDGSTITLVTSAMLTSFNEAIDSYVGKILTGDIFDVVYDGDNLCFDKDFNICTTVNWPHVTLKRVKNIKFGSGLDIFLFRRSIKT